MALKSTIYKAVIHLSDMDRNLYSTLNLILAQHPSETNQRLVVRLIAFILNADDELKFGKGLSDEDEAALWQIDYSDNISLWIELGQPEEKRIKRACQKAEQVKLYCFHKNNDVWWQQIKSKLNNYNNLTIEQFDNHVIEQLTTELTRTMEFQCSIQDSQLWLTSGEKTFLIERESLQC